MNRETGKAMLKNLGRFDRVMRVVLGIAIGVTGILVSSHPWLGRSLGVVGAVVILSGGAGT
jgi:hypothetical protein